MNRRSARNRHRRIAAPPVGEVRVVHHSPDHIEIRTEYGGRPLVAAEFANIDPATAFAGIDRSASPVRLAGVFRRPERSIVDTIEEIARMSRSRP